MMRLLDLMLFLGLRNSWARSRLAYRLLWSVFVSERKQQARGKPRPYGIS